MSPNVPIATYIDVRSEYNEATQMDDNINRGMPKYAPVGYDQLKQFK